MVDKTTYFSMMSFQLMEPNSIFSFLFSSKVLILTLPLPMGGGGDSIEVAFALLTQQPWVRLPAWPRFSSSQRCLVRGQY